VSVEEQRTFCPTTTATTATSITPFLSATARPLLIVRYIYVLLVIYSTSRIIMHLSRPLLVFHPCCWSGTGAGPRSGPGSKTLEEPVQVRWSDRRSLEVCQRSDRRNTSHTLRPFCFPRSPSSFVRRMGQAGLGGQPSRDVILVEPSVF
jgi:hypothetical protein